MIRSVVMNVRNVYHTQELLMRLFIFACFLFSLSTGAFAQSTQQERDRSSIRALIKGIHLLANSNLSCVSDKDCVLFPLGSKACGGPSSYVVTSVYNSNFEEIELLSEKSREKEYAYNLQYRVYSNCSLLDAPRPSCASKICTAY